MSKHLRSVRDHYEEVASRRERAYLLAKAPLCPLCGSKTLMFTGLWIKGVIEQPCCVGCRAYQIAQARPSGGTAEPDILVFNVYQAWAFRLGLL